MSRKEVMHRQLLEAARAGSLALVQEALQNGADVKFTNDNFRFTCMPLHLACENGHLDVVQYLLTSHGANLAADTDWLGRTPLHYACEQGRLDVVRCLLTCHDANLEALTPFDGETALHLACLHGHLDVVAYLLTSHNANLEATNRKGSTPLHIAAESRTQQLGWYLLNSGADPLSTDDRGELPLHRFCFRGHLGIVRALVDSNRDSIFVKAASDMTPLDFARFRHQDVINYLLAIYEETVFARESLLSIHSVLREATYSNDGNGVLKALLPIGELTETQMLNLLQALVDRSARMLHLVDRENGDVPLHIACATRAPISVVRFLVEADVATVKIVNRSSGALPIHVACDNRAPLDVLELIVESGGTDTLRERNVNGALPIHVACGADAPLEKIEFLVERGGAATLQERDANGALPMHCACHFGARFDVIQFLFENGGGATLKERDANGALPIHAACRACALVQVIQFLVDTGGINTLAAMDNTGSLPLHLFCRSGPSLRAIQWLGRFYPGFESTRTRTGDWPVLTAACDGSLSSLDVIYQLLRSLPNIIPAEL